jgi:hypothetical protein
MSASDETKPFSFDFGTSGTSEAKSGTLDASKSNLASDPSGAATSEAATHIESVRKKRGRPSADSSQAIAERERVREQLIRDFAALFEPEYWEGIVRGPADLMLHVSGRKLWDVPDKEIKPLAVGASNTVKMFLKTDPKWIALIMFSVSLTQTYGIRFALHMQEVRREAKERESRNRVADRGSHLESVTSGKPV